MHLPDVYTYQTSTPTRRLHLPDVYTYLIHLPKKVCTRLALSKKYAWERLSTGSDAFQPSNPNACQQPNGTVASTCGRGFQPKPSSNRPGRPPIARYLS